MADRAAHRNLDPGQNGCGHSSIGPEDTSGAQLLDDWVTNTFGLLAAAALIS